MREDEAMTLNDAITQEIEAALKMPTHNRLRLEGYDEKKGWQVWLKHEYRDAQSCNWEKWMWKTTQTLLGAVQDSLKMPERSLQYAGISSDVPDIMRGFYIINHRDKED